MKKANSQDRPVTQREFAKEMGDVKKEFNKRFGQVDKRFEQVDKRFEQVDKRFEQVDKRFEQVDKRFEQVELKLVKLDRKIDETFEEAKRHAGVLHEDVLHKLDTIIEALTPVLERQTDHEQRIQRLEDQVLFVK